MSSGIAVSDDCISKFNELKLQHSFRYLLYKVSDDKTSLTLESTGPKTATYDDFLKVLPKQDCRFAVFDFEFTAEGGQRSKICFIQWSPDVANVKSKMLYSASKDALKKKLVGIQTEIQATDESEISYQAVLDKASRFEK